MQDSEGYLWVATWSGLIRYDGYSAKVFHSGNSEHDLKSNLISCLFEDHEGTLWIGTHVSGLFQYDKKTNRFRNYRFESGNRNSISNNNIWKIIEDEDHNLWVATEDGLSLYHRETRQFTRFRNVPGNPNSLSANFITDIIISEDKSLWIATNYGLNKVKKERGQISFQRQVESFEDNFVYQVIELKQNNENEIWFITNKGIKQLKNNKITQYIANDKAPNFSLFRKMLLIDGEQKTLLLGSAMGLSFFNVAERKFEKHISNLDAFNNEQGQSMAVTAIYLDKGGVLWMGTKKGLFKCDSYKKDFDLFLTSSFDVTNSIITGIRPAADGYWVSTIGGGIFYFDGRKFTHFDLSVKSKNDFAPFVQSLFTDTKGNVWAGTAGAGVIVFNSTDAIQKNEILVTKHFHSTSTQAIGDDYIVSFTEDKSGAVWIGTWNGNLTRISPDGVIVSYDPEMFNHHPLVTLHTDNSGAIWVGSRGNGVFRIRQRNDKPEITHYIHQSDQRNSIVNNFINAIYEDHAGVLWIGTEGGLASFDRRTETFREIPIKEGPTNKVIVGILEDDSGKLWLSHWNGLTVFDPQDSTQRNIRNFDTHDFIQGGFFYNNVCLKDNKGKLLFGGSNGLNVIRPDNLVSNPIRPSIILTDFRLFNQTVVPDEKTNDRIILDQPLNDTKKIILQHDENTISFEFAALDFAAPEKIRYAYMLEGFDKDWNNTSSSRRYANYTNLTEGDYTFKVRSTNNDGAWNSETFEIRLVVLPPWWKTEWAFVSYVLMTAILLITFRKLILVRANFIHKLKLERVQRENMENLNRAKLQFFTNISHEFRTPLTLILGPVQNLIEVEAGSKFIRNQLHTISNNAQRLLRLVNQLLDFRKAETGNLSLQVSESNIVKFIKEIKLSFEGLAEERKINFSMHSSSNVIKAFFDRDQFEKILFNLLANAFRYTQESGAVTIQIIERSDDILISISNSGRGIKTEHFENIFQSFFSYDEERHSAGTGIGLALVKSLVDAHHGTIQVESVENEVTTFSISLLKGSLHFDVSEIGKGLTEDENINHYPVYPSDDFQFTEEKYEFPESIEGLPKILIVEDNVEVRGYIKSLFAGSYILLEAEHGKDGLTIAIEEIPDLVISDIMMPVMDGIKFCKELKSNIKTSHIPVVLLTARTSLIFKVEGLETGADDYVSKPFSPHILKLKVRNLLRTRSMLRKFFTDKDVLQIEPKRVTLNSADETFIQKVLDSIERNMSSPDYNVEILGEDVAMSRMQLYRKLKALTGQSAVEFVRTIRLKRAAQLLEQNQLTVSEITYQVGFNDLQYFRECFKKQFGMTPSEYVQNSLGKQVTG